MARASEAKTPEPDSSNLTFFTPVACNASRMLSIARAWASMSNPPARVSATSSALFPSRENHTPLRISGPPSGTSRSITCRDSPVGSCGRVFRMNGPAGDASSARLSLSAAESPAAVNRSGGRRAQQVALTSSACALPLPLDRHC